MVPAVDISQYQGTPNMATLPAIVAIKMSGGDDGLYFDADAAKNYTDAKAAGKAVTGYHFNGWVAGATQEAAFFFKAMSPVEENDVFTIDVESIPEGIDPVAYVLAEINYLEGKGIVGGLVYMDLATLNAYDWTPILTRWGLWLADWNNNPNLTIPTKFPYVMQQYNDGPNYDHDEWFGTVEEFNKYGYHAPQAAAPTPEPTPAPAPIPEPAQTTTEEPAPAPVQDPSPAPTTTTDTTSATTTETTTPSVSVQQSVPTTTKTPTTTKVTETEPVEKVGLLQQVLNALRKLVPWLK